MEIKGLDFKEAVLLAPLAGYSDVGFRAVCSCMGADATFSEMISAQAMKYENKKTQDLALRSPLERLCFAQIFGHDPAVMAEAVKNPMLDKFEGIDINLGCPAHKVVKNGEGSALLKNLPLAHKIVSSCVQVADRPVSVKVRLGYDQICIREIVRAMEDAGASFITVHGRTTAQGFSGEVNYEAIATAKSIAKIPVVGNGDVVDEKSYIKMKETGVDGVMVGRGAVGRPWVFSEIKNISPALSPFECLEKQVEILRAAFDENYLNLYLRKHFLAYAATFKAGSEIKRALALQTNIDESLKLLSIAAKHFEK